MARQTLEMAGMPETLLPERSIYIYLLKIIIYNAFYDERGNLFGAGGTEKSWRALHSISPTLSQKLVF